MERGRAWAARSAGASRRCPRGILEILESDSRISAKRLGLLGWALGGGVAIAESADDPRLGAVATVNAVADGFATTDERTRTAPGRDSNRCSPRIVSGERRRGDPAFSPPSRLCGWAAARRSLCRRSPQPGTGVWHRRHPGVGRGPASVQAGAIRRPGLTRAAAAPAWDRRHDLYPYAESERLLAGRSWAEDADPDRGRRAHGMDAR